jgi:hypothetical protein
VWEQIKLQEIITRWAITSWIAQIFGARLNVRWHRGTNSNFMWCSSSIFPPFYWFWKHNSLFDACPRPSDQPRDAARWEECSDLDEKSLTTFCCWDERAKGNAGEHLMDFMRLKWTTQNDALVEDRQQEYPSIRWDHDVAVCPIPGMYVELQDLQFNNVAMRWRFATSGYAEVWLQ